MEGLVLLNIDPNGKGWIDWAATKVPVYQLVTKYHKVSLSFSLVTIALSVYQLSGLTSALPDTVLSHLFSQVSTK